MGVYGAFLKNGFLTQMAHRGQYAMRMLAKIMGWSTGMIMVLILLERFGQIGGWNREEILLLYAFDILSYSVAATFFMGSFGKLHRLIRQGELDLVLTKPADPMIYLAASHVSAGYTSNYLMGGAVLVICLIRLGQLPAWVVIVIISREFIISGFRLVAADNGIVIAASYWGKFKTVFQMTAVVLLIFNIPPLSVLTSAVLWIAVILTVVSLVDYVAKNIKVLTEGGL